jgi:hypothetical protein
MSKVSPSGRRKRQRRPPCDATSVQTALPIVIFVVVGLAAAVALFTLVSGRGAYDHIGRSDLTYDREAPGVRDEEIRQLLAARNARRAARGEPAQDVEAELAALTRPAVDDELRSEIRSLVEARNARRVARGRPPLDVEAEVERRLNELDG